MCYRKYIPSCFGYLLLLILWIVFPVTARGTVYYKSHAVIEDPRLKNRKAVNVKGVAFEKVVDLLLPSGFISKMDDVAREYKITYNGEISLAELLSLMSEKVDYSLKGNVLEINGLVRRTYSLPFMAGDYSSSQSYGSSGVSGGATGGGGGRGGGGVQSTQGGGGGGGSTSASVSVSNSISFWNEIKTEIENILAGYGTGSQQSQQLPGTGPSNLQQGLQNVVANMSASGGTAPALVGGQPVRQMAGAGQAGQQVGGGPQAQLPAGGEVSGTVVINRTTGTLVVIGPKERLKEVDYYIETIKQKLLQSIEIDFTLIEVTENTSHNWGVSWQMVLRGILFQPPERWGMTDRFTDITFGIPTTGIDASIVNQTYRFGFKGEDKQQVIIEALKKVADIRVINKTTLLLKNNTTSGFSVGVNRSYIDSVSRTIEEGVVTYEVQKGNILSGLDLSISAVLDEENITLTIVPSISQLERLETLNFDTIQIQNPITTIRQSVATVTLKDGETTAVVAYNLDNIGKEKSNLPLFGDIPLIGIFFSSLKVTNNNSSLVMLLTPRIKKL